jgi:plasmid stabilization system protein ParE
MRHRLRLAAKVELDLASAAAWYRDQRDGLEIEFLAEVYDYFDSICDQPEIYAPVVRNARQAILNRFPCAIYYIAQGNQVVVYAVVHTARDPSTWQTRIP